MPLILSQKHKVLYVAVPKTATTAVQKWLLQENLEFKKGINFVNDSRIMLLDHVSASKARELLGIDYYDKLHVIAFIRYPYSRIVSGYNFYKGGAKNGSILNKQTIDKKKRLLHALQILIARILPFWLWALVYPYKDNKRYCVDANDNIIVSHIGIYENLVNDMALFLKDINLNADINNLSYINKSTKNASTKVIKSKCFQKLLLMRHKNLKEDLEFYKAILSKQDSIKK